MIRRLGKRASLLFHSKNYREFIDNLTPFTIQFIAAIPLFIYMIQPILYLPEGFEGKITLMASGSYEVNLNSIVPIILAFWGITVIFCVLKVRQVGRSICSILRENPVYIFFLCFLIWMLTSVTVNGFTDITLFGDSYRNEGILTYAYYICVFFFLGSIITDEKIKRFLCDTSLVSSIGTAAYAYYRYYYLQTPANHLEDFPAAFFSQFNHYGYFLGMNVMLAAGLFVMASGIGRQIWYLIAFSVNVWMLNLNNTFGAWLACIAGFVFMLVARKIMSDRFDWKPLIPATIFAIITIIMSIMGHGQLSSLMQFSEEIQTVSSESAQLNSTGARWNLWKNIIRFIRKHPIFGYGVEGTGEMLLKVADNDRCHCEYMQYAADFGIPAAILYIMGCAGVIARNVRRRKSLHAISFACLTAAFTYMVSAVVGNSMYNCTPFFFIFLGLGYRGQNNQEK